MCLAAAEQLIRLPGCFLCYTPADDAPPVAPLPALQNGFITFGSFNALAKQTPEVRACLATPVQYWAAELPCGAQQLSCLKSVSAALLNIASRSSSQMLIRSLSSRLQSCICEAYIAIQMPRMGSHAEPC